MRLCVVLSILLAAGASPGFAQRPTPVTGLPCEGCEVALEGLPPSPPSTARLAPPDEPGEPLRLTGTILDAEQRPQRGVVVYAYQTDRGGIYPVPDAPVSAAARRHGRLRGWATSDAAGTYTFLTIRPGDYPGSDIPQHIHLHVIEPGCATYYIDDVMFRDDPRLTPHFVATLDRGRGGSGVVAPVLRDGVWQVRRDIVLGRNIPDYRPCAPAAPSP